MKTIERICSHDIEFNYFSKSKDAKPGDNEIEHVQDCLINNYIEGELYMVNVNSNNGHEYEFSGWWKILN